MTAFTQVVHALPKQALMDPRQLGETLATLPQDAPESALSQLQTWITQLREVIVPTEAEFTAAPLLDASVREHYRDATRRFLAARNELNAYARTQLFESVEHCLVSLAGLHQWLAAQWAWSDPAAEKAIGGALVELPASPAPVIMAGIRACAAVRKWSRLFKRDVRPGVWADLCSLYLLAAERGCATTACMTVPGGSTTSTPEREFLKACVLASVDTGRLLPEQLDIAERAIELCEHLQLADKPAEALPFAVDLGMGGAPAPCETVVPGANVYYFGIDARDVRLADLVRQIEAGRISPTLFGHPNREVVVHALRFVLMRLKPA